MADSLAGKGEAHLETLSRDALILLCKERSIAFSRKTKDELVDDLLSWKRKQAAKPKLAYSAPKSAQKQPAEVPDWSAITGAGVAVYNLPLAKAVAPVFYVIEGSAPLAQEKPKKDWKKWKKDKVEKKGGFTKTMSAARSDAMAPAKKNLPKAPGPPNQEKKPTTTSWSSSTKGASGASASSSTSATTSKPTTLFQKLSRGQYRYRMAKVDPSATHDDVDVCHIIAKSNGGADAAENYIIMNHALNVRLGNKGDHVMAYIVGIHKTISAVEASKEQTNYKGPEASELYRKGEAFFRDNFGAHLRETSSSARINEAMKCSKS